MIERLFRVVLTHTRKMSSDSFKGIELGAIVKGLNEFAPPSLAEKWDNIGLLVEPVTPKPVNCILLTNDLTEDVVAEAVNLNAGLIISYHPPIFKPLTKITATSWKERVIGTCLENRIAVYSPHTSWDSVPGGVNDWLVGAFDVASVRPIAEAASGDVPNAGVGRYCELKNDIKMSEAIESVKKLTCLQYLNVSLARNATLDTKVRSVAVCAGSGSSVLAGIRADLYLTGEMSHHSLLDTLHNDTSVILCNHSNSERGFLRTFAKVLESQYQDPGMRIHVSKADKDPIQVV